MKIKIEKRTVEKAIKQSVSVVVINFNAGKYLTDCINSVREQTYKSIEIIVIDNKFQ